MRYECSACPHSWLAFQPSRSSDGCIHCTVRSLMGCQMGVTHPTANGTFFRFLSCFGRTGDMWCHQWGLLRCWERSFQYQSVLSKLILSTYDLCFSCHLLCVFMLLLVAITAPRHTLFTHTLFTKTEIILREVIHRSHFQRATAGL